MAKCIKSSFLVYNYLISFNDLHISILYSHILLYTLAYIYVLEIH